MGIVFGLIAVLTFLFFREVLPVPLTALLAAVVLMVTGILTPEEGLSGFSSQATIAVLAMFVLSAGVQRSGAVESLTQRMAAWAGKSQRKQIFALGMAAGPLSGFVNNTPVVAVMIPAALSMGRKAGTPPSRLLMPLSNLAMLGGLLTIVGTSSSLLGNAVLERMGHEPFAFFEFTVVGAIALLTGLVYYLTVGVHILPDRGRGDFVERFDLDGFLGEFMVPEGSEYADKTLRESGLSVGAGVQVIRLHRGDNVIDAPSVRMKLRAEDSLLVEASRERLSELRDQPQLDALAEVKHPLEFEDTNDLATAELVLTTGSPYIARTVAQVDFRNRFGVLVLGVRHQGRAQFAPTSRANLRAGDVLLVQGPPAMLERMREQPGFYLTREREVTADRRRKMPLALAIIAGVVLVSALGWLPISVAAVAGAVAMVVVGCLTMDEFIASIRWDVILLLAGIIPLGLALEKTGAAALLADALVAAGSPLPVWVFLVLLFIVTSLITEIASNNASVVLIVPIAVTAALAIGLDPRPVALTVIFAASTSMMTPIGYQTNTMIYAPGNYRFSDYARAGGPLNLLLALIVPATILWAFPA